MKEALAKKQANFETELDTREKRLEDTSLILQLAEAEIVNLKMNVSHILKICYSWLQDILQIQKEDRTARNSQLTEYQKGINEQIEEKNEQNRRFTAHTEAHARAHPLLCH